MHTPNTSTATAARSPIRAAYEAGYAAFVPGAARTVPPGFADERGSWLLGFDNARHDLARLHDAAIADMDALLQHLRHERRWVFAEARRGRLIHDTNTVATVVRAKSDRLMSYARMLQRRGAISVDQLRCFSVQLAVEASGMPPRRSAREMLGLDVDLQHGPAPQLALFAA